MALFSSTKKPSTISADVVVIGSGAAGSIAAQTLANAKKKTVLIEMGSMGGDCANYTSVPTRAMLESVHVKRTAENALKVGVTTGKTSLSYDALLTWRERAIAKTGVVNTLTTYESEYLKVLKGRAHFLDPYTITVGLKKVTALRFIIASGSRPSIPSISGIESVPYVTYRSFSEQKKTPKSVAIVGSDQRAYEYAQIYQSMGCAVTIYDKHSHLLLGYDVEVRDAAQSALTASGCTVRTLANITHVKKSPKGVTLTYEQDGQTHHAITDMLFIADGSTPNTDIGLENARVTYTDDGIVVNRALRTSQKHIYAAGDVNGQGLSTSGAIWQGQIAANNAFHRKNVLFNKNIVPDAIFGWPEIATVGMSEQDIRLTGLPYQTSIAPIALVGRSFSSAYSEGFVKIVASHKGVVIGASIVAPHASELIGELAFAITHHRRACDITQTIHVFSTWSEAIKVAAQKIYCI